MKLKGSYTVEMAFVLPIIFILTGLILSLSFYLYDLAALHGWAYKAVAAGQEEMETPALLSVKLDYCQIEIQEDLISVKIKGGHKMPFLGVFSFGEKEVLISADRKKTGQISFIRTCRILEKTFDGVIGP